jgi:hypothetical protein
LKIRLGGFWKKCLLFSWKSTELLYTELFKLVSDFFQASHGSIILLIFFAGNVHRRNDGWGGAFRQSSLVEPRHYSTFIARQMVGV